MKLGTFVYDNKIYNLEYMISDELKQLINLIQKNKLQNVNQIKDEEVISSAKLHRLYEYKVSNEIVNQKVNNQLNSIKISINKINSKFIEKSKNYDKVKYEIINFGENYKNVLMQYSELFDKKLEELIIEKTQLECKLRKLFLDKKNIIQEESQEKIEKSNQYKANQKAILYTRKELKNLNKKIYDLEIEKKNKLFEAMEVGGKSISVQIKRPRKIKNITKFFVNRFNTYKVVMKNVIEPLNQRIDEFKVNELGKVDGKIYEFDYNEIEEKIKEKIN